MGCSIWTPGCFVFAMTDAGRIRSLLARERPEVIDVCILDRLDGDGDKNDEFCANILIERKDMKPVPYHVSPHLIEIGCAGMQLSSLGDCFELLPWIAYHPDSFDITDPDGNKYTGPLVLEQSPNVIVNLRDKDAVEAFCGIYSREIRTSTSYKEVRDSASSVAPKPVRGLRIKLAGNFPGDCYSIRYQEQNIILSDEHCVMLKHQC